MTLGSINGGLSQCEDGLFVLIPRSIALQPGEFANQYVESFLKFFEQICMDFNLIQSSESQINLKSIQIEEDCLSHQKKSALNQFRELGLDVDYYSSTVVYHVRVLKFFKTEYIGKIYFASFEGGLFQTKALTQPIQELLNRLSIAMLSILDQDLINSLVNQIVTPDEVFGYPLVKQSCKLLLGQNLKKIPA
ncbi:MAG: hypothetical protein ACRCXZ_04255 [Patescibacteria group bacterium]